MHQITISNGFTVTQQVDIDALQLNGRRAVDLSREEVFRALAVLKVPGLDERMGKQQMLVSYAHHLLRPAA